MFHMIRSVYDSTAPSQSVNLLMVPVSEFDHAKNQLRMLSGRFAVKFRI